MKKKWLVLIGALLLFSMTFANKTAGMDRSISDVETKTKIEKVNKK
ncbi:MULTISPECIES: hypothetical protein [Psychrilyobacter]|nr:MULTISPECIES: hypothetical protein [Psychrilyobacter]MCS5423156.1 hypothetical protein [Psychrilyobacter sp. S5]NDI76921.1 hypothetical protein [Psychrilyobacter piezotolerans]